MQPQRVAALRILTFLAIVAFSASVLHAQTTGSIEGRILAPDGSVLPGATVTASGGIPGERSTVSDDTGSYYMAALPPGTYQLRVTLSGFGSQTRSAIVSLGATTTADFSLLPAVSQQTTVVGESPLVDTHAVAVGNTVDARAFSRLPLARNYASIAAFQPGVTQDDAGLSVLGATGLENAYFIDGVDVTGIRLGDQTKAVPEEFLQEVQVRTATYPAEYGGASGGVINAVTRSGGNEYHAEVFGFFDNQSLQAKAKPGVTGGNFAGFTNADYGLGLGGYLLRDQLWFFGVYDRTNLVRDVRLVTGSGSPYDGSRFRSQDRNSNLYSVKLTWTASPSIQAIASVIGDPADDAQQLVEDGPPQTRRIHEATGGPDVSFSATKAADQWLAQIGFFDHREKSNRAPDFAPPFLTSDSTQVPTFDIANCNLPGCYSGAPWVFIPTNPALLDQQYERRQEQASMTGYIAHHQLKVGVQFSQIEGDVVQAVPGGYDRILNRLANGMILYTQSWFGDPSGQYGIDHVVQSVSGHPKTNGMSAYLQDSWTPIPNLTLDIGVRYDQFDLKDAVTGTTITTLKDNYAPRIGVSWDPGRQGREKVTIAYGRFFQPIPMNLQAQAFAGSSVSVTSPFGFSFNCDQMAVNCQSYPNRIPEPADPGLKAPSTEQFSLGYETKLTDRLKVGAYAFYSRLVRAVEDRCDVQGNNAALAFTGNGCVLMNPGFGDYGRGVFPAIDLGNGPEQILCTNGLNQDEGRAPEVCQPLPKAKRTYEGIALMAEQRFSPDTYLLASYVYSRLRGNYDGAYNELGQSSPNTNLDFDYPGLLANAYGRLANDRPNQFKVTAYHRLPFGLTVGLNAYYRSGTPEDKLGSFAVSPVGAPIPLYLAPRGSQGRTPADWDADLHIDYTMPVGSVHVSVIADIFRIFNRQTVLRTDPFYNFDGYQADNVVQTNPDYQNPIERADPRLVRVGLRVWF
jgi:outer membrane receptor protein involved in Fe transport